MGVPIGTIKPVVAAAPRRACSFCGQDEHDVAHLLQGSVAFICDGCVQQCSAILKQLQRKEKR